jgi:hypothetical protein
VTTETNVWREVAIGIRNPAFALASGAIEVEGSTLDLVRFLRLFSRDGLR